MKIMHVVESYGGGVFTSVNQLCNGFCEEHEVVLVHGLREETPSDYKSALNRRVRSIQIPFTREINPLVDFKSLKALVSLLKAERPDVVHLHSSKAGFLGRLAGAVVKHPAVFYSPRAFAFLDPAASPLKRRLYRQLEIIGGKLGGVVVGCSRDEAEEAKSIAPNVVQINNSIDVGFLATLEKKVLRGYGGATRPLTVGVHARVKDAKRPDLFLDVAKRVKATHPDVRFLWIGGGDPFFKDVPEVECTGWLGRTEALEAVSQEVDIYLLTSAYEGLPLSVIEAGALGKPAVCTNVSGTRSAVEDGVTGYLCEAEDVSALTTAVLRLVEDTGLRKKLGEAARAHAKQEFDTPLMLARYESLFRYATTGHTEDLLRAA